VPQTVPDLKSSTRAVLGVRISSLTSCSARARFVQ
jgi:hypothetical protein